MRFSQRMGLIPIKVDIQKDGMDKELRIGLWNVFYVYIGSERPINDLLLYSTYGGLIIAMWADFYKKPLDSLNKAYSGAIRTIKKWFFDCQWYEIYDFLEFIVGQPSNLDKVEFKNACNEILESEVSAYRFVGDVIGPIVDENEIIEIEDSILRTQSNRFEGVNMHLKTSLSMLTDRKNPDYRNSIKESISAIEALLKIITGDTKGDLNRAMRKLKDKITIHPALEKAFISLYGYTSDEGGIRHAMLEDNDISFEDAKYMLVSCSAFTNYLISKVNKYELKI